MGSESWHNLKLADISAQPFYSENFYNKAIRSVNELNLSSAKNQRVVSDPIFISNAVRGECTLTLFRMDVCSLWEKVEH